MSNKYDTFEIFLLLSLFCLSFSFFILMLDSESTHIRVPLHQISSTFAGISRGRTGAESCIFPLSIKHANKICDKSKRNTESTIAIITSGDVTREGTERERDSLGMIATKLSADEYLSRQIIQQTMANLPTVLWMTG